MKGKKKTVKKRHRKASLLRLSISSFQNNKKISPPSDMGLDCKSFAMNHLAPKAPCKEPPWRRAAIYKSERK